MKIQINSDRHIEGHEQMSEAAEASLSSTLGHLATHVSRVEVHVSDENGDRGGSMDKRCMMEARLEGHRPIAVTHEASSVEQAIDGAAEKLKSALDSILGKLRTY